ncbi:MAG: nitrilase-related carbon-nitrogen hydrolase [Thermodesulfobacteriota bacterium]|nr:nitrilase-related carbon-nitrogen hydrolase [Thermodesulfobacteriota bacterium]
MRVAICQTQPSLLDVQTNLESVIAHIHKCREHGAQLVVFPELALTGYFVGLQYHKAALRLDSDQIQALAAATKGTAAVVGFIEESRSMNFYNSALIAVDGEILFAYRKLNLPNYGAFEERKFFANGKHIRVFRLNHFNVSVFICNDMWHPALPYLGVTQKADIFVSIINSSEESMGAEFSNMESWDIINRFYSRVFGIYNICANRVGTEDPDETWDIPEDDKLLKKTSDVFLVPEVKKRYRFWGGSEIINPFGQRIYKARLYETDVIMGELSRDLVRRKKILLPYLRNDDPYFTRRELHRILFEQAGDGSRPRDKP